MKEIVLVPKFVFRVPVEAEVISPDVFEGKSVDDVTELTVLEGNRRTNLGSLFKVEGNGSFSSKESVIVIKGDVSKVRRIGRKMTTGKIVVEGLVGLYLGEEMKGGTIMVDGDSGSFTGMRMRDGLIEVKGNAGDYLASSYRGGTSGMRGGTIIVHGNAGNEVGCWMEGGLVVVKGSVASFAGIHMKGGSLLIEGNSEDRLGAEMVDGKIVLLGYVPSILPSFTFEEIRKDTKIGEARVSGPFYVFIGDLTEDGKGKMFVSVDKNLHLKFYEKYLEV